MKSQCIPGILPLIHSKHLFARQCPQGHHPQEHWNSLHVHPVKAKVLVLAWSETQRPPVQRNNSRSSLHKQIPNYTTEISIKY